jgi:ABC-2 type transport system permease protein
MHKIYVIATTEFGSAVRTKSFLIGILLLPVIMGGSIVLQLLAARQVDTKPRRFAVVDHSGMLYRVIEDAARTRNAREVLKGGKQVAPRFEPERVDAQGRPDQEVLLGLSERVRKGDLFAFIEIPAGLDDPNGSATTIPYHSDNPNYNDLRGWLDATITAAVRTRRYRAAGIDPSLTARLDRPVFSENLGLLAREAPAPSSGRPAAPGAAGKIKAAERVDPIRTFAVPAVLLFVTFLVVMSSAPQLLNSVIEEKMSRISEVLLGSVTPFELMMGKLLGNAGIALVLATLYVGAGYGFAAYKGYGDAVPPHLLATMALFLVLAVFLFGSMYLAVGSACSELKDAQSLMMPVMLLSMLPMFVWTAVIQNPASPLSVGMSLFPFATPYLMLVRMALHPSPPFWQVGLSVVLTTATAVACVWAAGKIFRTGLLMQGKAPSFVQLARWVMAK